MTLAYIANDVRIVCAITPKKRRPFHALFASERTRGSAGAFVTLLGEYQIYSLELLMEKRERAIGTS